MSRRWMTLAALGVLLCAIPAVAEHHEASNLARVTFWTAADDGFEAGLAAHNEFHVAQNDEVAHFTWQIVTGKRAGTYVRASFNHKWSEFDVEPEFAAADEADSAETLDPHIGSAIPQIWAQLDDLSRAPDGAAPRASSSVRSTSLNRPRYRPSVSLRKAPSAFAAASSSEGSASLTAPRWAAALKETMWPSESVSRSPACLKTTFGCSSE